MQHQRKTLNNRIVAAAHLAALRLVEGMSANRRLGFRQTRPRFLATCFLFIRGSSPQGASATAGAPGSHAKAPFPAVLPTRLPSPGASARPPLPTATTHAIPPEVERVHAASHP